MFMERLNNWITHNSVHMMIDRPQSPYSGSVRILYRIKFIVLKSTRCAGASVRPHATLFGPIIRQIDPASVLSSTMGLGKNRSNWFASGSSGITCLREPRTALPTSMPPLRRTNCLPFLPIECPPSFLILVVCFSVCKFAVFDKEFGTVRNCCRPVISTY